MEPKEGPEDRRADEGEWGGPPWRTMRGMGWGMGRGMRWRIALSIILFFGLIAFIIVWLFFFADAFSPAQNVAIFLLALLVFFGLQAAVRFTMWRRWGRRGRHPPGTKASLAPIVGP